MFGIFVEPADGVGENGVGEIVIGEWSEGFELDVRERPLRWDAIQFMTQWQSALQRLVESGEPVALLLDAPSGMRLRAWVCYPEGARVYIQFKEFNVGENAIEVSESGVMTGIEPRETFTDYGLPIAERYCDLTDISDFLARAT